MPVQVQAPGPSDWSAINQGFHDLLGLSTLAECLIEPRDIIKTIIKHLNEQPDEEHQGEVRKYPKHRSSCSCGAKVHHSPVWDAFTSQDTHQICLFKSFHRVPMNHWMDLEVLISWSLENGPILRLSRGPPGYCKLRYNPKELIVNNKRHSHHSGNFKGFRNSVSGAGVKDQIYIWLYHHFHNGH